jgi:hypothetical protein
MFATVYRIAVLSLISVFKWFRGFIEGQENYGSVTGCELLKIWKELQKLMSWWPKTV